MWYGEHTVINRVLAVPILSVGGDVTPVSSDCGVVRSQTRGAYRRDFKRILNRLRGWQVSVLRALTGRPRISCGNAHPGT